jgi:hypothetical protein
MRLHRSIFLLVLLLTACQPAFLAGRLPTLATFPPSVPQPSSTSSPTSLPALDSTSTVTSLPVSSLESSTTPAPTSTPLPAGLGLDPADWKNWPVLPIVPERARQIYQLGQTLGNDPHAFSVFGDCQSEPDVFMGVYETDPAAVASLPADLQETAAWFTGSFNRLSPTVRGGTTTGALLWSVWHQNKFTCTEYESPVTCELRIHKPAFVIIHVGTHYENRNTDYMRKILNQLIMAVVVPILATKADNRELDNRVNTAYAQIAVEYNIPFWNFWAAVDDLPNRGLYTRPDATYQGDLYLTEAAAAIHRLSALVALDVVRRAASGQ